MIDRRYRQYRGGGGGRGGKYSVCHPGYITGLIYGPQGPQGPGYNRFPLYFLLTLRGFDKNSVPTLQFFSKFSKAVHPNIWISQ